MNHIAIETVGKEGYPLKSYEIIVEADGKVDRKVVDANTKTEAKKLTKEMYPGQKVEFVMIKQVV